MNHAAADIGRLRWRCRRGMKELDILLSRYVDRHFMDAPPHEQEAFQALLETQDPLIYAYCMGSQSPPARFEALVNRITAYAPADR